MNWQTLLPLLLLVPVSLLPALTSKASSAYCLGAALLWSGFVYYGTRFIVRKSNSSARRLLSASIIYLPSLFGLMIFLREGSGWLAPCLKCIASISTDFGIHTSLGTLSRSRIACKRRSLQELGFSTGNSLLFDRDAIRSNHNSCAIRALLTVNKYLRAWMAVKVLCQIPCIGPIRAALLLALMQTPYRFRSAIPFLMFRKSSAAPWPALCPGLSNLPFTAEKQPYGLLGPATKRASVGGVTDESRRRPTLVSLCKTNSCITPAKELSAIRTRLF